MLKRAARLMVVASVAAAFVALVSAPAQAADRDPSSVLVKFSIPSQLGGALGAYGDRVGARMDDNVVLVRLPAGTSVDAAVSRYNRLFGVAYAEPNYIATADALSSPNDPSFGSQWNLGKISAVAGWSRLFTSSYPTSLGGALIAVLDTGVQASHPDLSGRVLAGGNCVSAVCSAGGSDDDNNHGTHVAGIAAAGTNNGVGIAGLALTSKILPVKVLDANGSGSYAAIAAGIDWAVSQGARVINMSLSGSSSSTTLCGAVSRAISAGVVVVAAAGNSSSSARSYPAACTGSIGVSATDSADLKAPYSNYGSPNVFVSAPGSSIYSTIAGSSYATFNGTSMAAPHVTGLVALLRTQNPSLTVSGVKTLLATTSDKVGGTYGSDPYGTCAGCTWSSSFGYGRINVDRALSGGGAPPPPTPDPPPPPPPPPPPSGTPSTAAPTAVTVLSGSTVSGTAANLATANSSYYVVRTPYTGNLSWYGTFTVGAAATGFKATFTGRSSKACTFGLAIYRWTTGAWVTMGSASTIGTTSTTVADAAAPTSVPASELRSSANQVRVRVTCSASLSFYQWALSSDLLRLSYTP